MRKITDRDGEIVKLLLEGYRPFSIAQQLGISDSAVKHHLTKIYKLYEIDTRQVLDKMPLKSKTAWSHLKTVKCASQIVNSWPDWKRDIVISRPGKSFVKNSIERIAVENIIDGETDAGNCTAHEDQGDGLRHHNEQEEAIQMAKIITFTIDEHGDVLTETAGWQGKGCDSIQKVFGDALGTTVNSVKKPEYARQPNNKNVVKQ